MTRKRNKFWLFCFSLIPGAGEMYLGFMKQGASLMTLFFAAIGLASWLHVGILAIFVPVLWFYSFFHAHNLNGMSDEEFYMMEDDFLFHAGTTFDSYFFIRYKKLIAIALILVGVTIVWNNFVSLFLSHMPSFLVSIFRSLGYYVPQIIVGSLIIMAGLYLIGNKRKELDDRQ